MRPGERRAGHYARLDCGDDQELSDAVKSREEEERGHDDFLPVYVLPANRRNCEKALKWLQAKAETNHVFRLYGLHHLLVKILESLPTGIQVLKL